MFIKKIQDSKFNSNNSIEKLESINNISVRLSDGNRRIILKNIMLQDTVSFGMNNTRLVNELKTFSKKVFKGEKSLFKPFAKRQINLDKLERLTNEALNVFEILHNNSKHAMSTNKDIVSDIIVSCYHKSGEAKKPHLAKRFLSLSLSYPPGSVPAFNANHMIDSILQSKVLDKEEILILFNKNIPTREIKKPFETFEEFYNYFSYQPYAVSM
ncbi:MAG: hypothetical protein WCY19_05830 [Candidatus Gastranaerophilaceae bacterium]